MSILIGVVTNLAIIALIIYSVYDWKKSNIVDDINAMKKNTISDYNKKLYKRSKLVKKYTINDPEEIRTYLQDNARDDDYCVLSLKDSDGWTFSNYYQVHDKFYGYTDSLFIIQLYFQEGRGHIWIDELEVFHKVVPDFALLPVDKEE